MAQKKIEEVTDEFWDNEVNDVNRELIDDFLSQQHLTPRTIKQYTSALKIFARWVHENVRPKGEAIIPDLRPKDARQYQDWCLKMGLSPSAVKFKRSAVSSLCGFIEVYYDREYKNFRNIYSKAIPNVTKANKKEKLPLSKKEIDTLLAELKKRGELQKIAYIYFIYNTACRREESRQLLKEVATYSKVLDKEGNEKKYYLTHSIRAKGTGEIGKQRKFKFDEKAMQAIKEWIEYRNTQVENDDCPYVFVSKTKDGYKQLSANTFNLWCDGFSKILGGRPVHPHLFRSSRATNAVVEEGLNMKAVQTLLGHNSSQTTEIYVVRDSTDDDDELYD